MAARLGIADIVADGPKSHSEIARATNCDEAAVKCLMDVLSTYEVFELAADGRYKNGELSGAMRSDHPMSLRYFCMLGGEQYYDAWGALLHTVQTGQPAFPEVFGSDIYEYMNSRPEVARVYDLAMEDLTRPVGMLLGAMFDFSGVHHVVDVGGGGGMLLKQVLKMHGHLRGTCVDRADVCDRARQQLEGEGNGSLEGRLEFVAGDIFGDLPRGGEVYTLKNVLHNWNDAHCREILEAIRRAMTRTAQENDFEPRLLVIEPLAEDDASAGRNVMDALFQMVICQEGSHARGPSDFEAMLRQAGLGVVKISPLPTGHGIIEAQVGPVA